MNICAVVGEKEKSNGTVNVRTRDNKVHGEFSLAEVMDKFNRLRDERILKSEEYGWGPEEEKVPSVKNLDNVEMIRFTTVGLYNFFEFNYKHFFFVSG